MEEATGRGSVFDGVVGQLARDSCELTGIEGNQLSGTLKSITELETVTRQVTPSGRERKADEISGKFFFLVICKGG